MGAVRGGTFQKIAMEKLPAGCVTATREYPGSTELFLDLATDGSTSRPTTSSGRTTS